MPPALPYPCLCLVTDNGVCPPAELAARVAAAVAGGVDLVQFRAKEQPGAVMLEQVAQLRKVCRGRALLVVNERADVARAGGADGVQLGEAAMATGLVRPIVGAAALIGRSVHSVAGAVTAAADGADFLLVGTMFATRSHPGAEPAGPGLLARIAAAGVDRPLLGIGGVTADNAGPLMAAGAYGAAAITSVLASDDPEAAARRLKSALTNAACRQPTAIRPLAAGAPAVRDRR